MSARVPAVTVHAGDVVALRNGSRARVRIIEHGRHGGTAQCVTRTGRRVTIPFSAAGTLRVVARNLAVNL